MTGEHTSSDATELRTVKLVGGGRALAHADGSTWMVAGALPGERVLARPHRRRARIVEADTIEVLDDHHAARIPEPCRHAPSCGGCDWPHVDLGLGALLKKEVAAEAAARFPELASRLRDAPIKASPPSYRLRCRLHWNPETATLGFYAPKSWQVSAIPGCRIVSPGLREALSELTAALADSCPAAVDLEWLEGGGTAVAAIRPRRGGPKSLREDWVPVEGSCTALSGCHRLSTGGEVLSGWGSDRVRMDLPAPLEVPIGSFFQCNLHLVPWLFRRVADLVGPGPEPVVDLHGGVGFLAAAAGWVGRERLTVVELHEPTADAARINLPDARVEVRSAEDFLERHRGSPAAFAVTDPPRTGLSAELRRRLVDWRPERLLMLGCDPATWSRDAAFLIDHGYHLSHLEMVDLFPSTHHVEVLARLDLA